jgi:hypothetical protein
MTFAFLVSPIVGYFISYGKTTATYKGLLLAIKDYIRQEFQVEWKPVAAVIDFEKVVVSLEWLGPAANTTRRPCGKHSSKCSVRPL